MHKYKSAVREGETHSLSVLAPGINIDHSLGGVTLYLDWENEVYCIHVQPFHSRKALIAAGYAVESLGLEVMHEFEHPVEIHTDGSLTYWLAESQEDWTLCWPYT